MYTVSEGGGGGGGGGGRWVRVYFGHFNYLFFYSRIIKL